MKKAFTMIELIFVIVIIGILAAVAIPKLMATRTDAKIAAISQEASNIISEVPAYVTSQGKVSNFITMSQVAKTLVDQNQAYDYNTSTGKLSLKNDVKSDIDTNATNYIDTLILGTPDNNGDLKPCLAFEVNSTTLVVTDANSSDVGDVCAGVQARVKEANYTIAGQGVKF